MDESEQEIWIRREKEVDELANNILNVLDGHAGDVSISAATAVVAKLMSKLSVDAGRPWNEMEFMMDRLMGSLRGTVRDAYMDECSKRQDSE